MGFMGFESPRALPSLQISYSSFVQHEVNFSSLIVLNYKLNA